MSKCQSSISYRELVINCSREEFEATKPLLIRAAKNDLPFISLTGANSVDMFNCVHNPVLQLRIEQDYLIALTKTHEIRLYVVKTAK